MKRFVTLLLAAALLGGLLTTPPPARAADDTSLRVLLDQKSLTFGDVAPRIEADRALVPFRALASALGATVEWDPETRGITARGLGHVVHLTVDQVAATVDGAAATLDVPARVVEGRTLVPLRFFATAFGAGVGYDSVTRTASLTSPVWQPTSLAFYAIRSFDERNLVRRLNVVAFGWSILTPQGEIDLHNDPDFHWPEAAGAVTPESILQDAANAGTHRLLMVYMSDRSDDLTRLVTTPALRSKAAANIAAAVLSKGLDGVELDLEGLGLHETGGQLTAVQEGFTALVADVAARLHRVGKSVVVSVPPPNGAYHGYNLKALADVADLLELMAHDYIQDGKPEPTDLVAQAVEQTLAQVPPYKVLLALNLPVETAQSVSDKVKVARTAWLKGIALWRLGVVKDERLGALQAEGVLHP